MSYKANDDRYSGTMEYRASGRTGLRLPVISLGLWQNFGAGADDTRESAEILTTAFDKGVTYFDLANNYGPPPGQAETNFGKIFKDNFKPYRDELVIATKAGFDMWNGPYGDGGSRKYMIASCDQSLRRMGLDYVDIFYSHRYDPGTPLEETMGALDYIVRSGRALYAALSNYPHEQFVKAVAILTELGTPCIAHQIRYSMLVRDRGDSLFSAHRNLGVGCVSYSPLAQGLLSDKYLDGIPECAKTRPSETIQHDFIEANLSRVRALNKLAEKRGQTLSQMAIAWQLRNDNVTSVLIGVSSKKQLTENLGALGNTSFSAEENKTILRILES